MEITPDLHDGYLRSIALVGEDSVEVGCRSLSGQVVTFSIGGVERLLATNFLAGNIILEVRTFSGADISLESVATVMGEQPDSYSVKAMFDTARSDNWTALEIDSSYGCDLRVLGRFPLRVTRA